MLEKINIEVLRILHITSWYPNKGNGREALFIRRHLEALNTNQEVEQKVIHLSVGPGRMYFSRYSEGNTSHYILSIPIRKWIIIELISTFLLMIILLRHKSNSFDVINFHIAYPNLTFWHIIKRWFRSQIVITEHWSAYHLNFGLMQPPPRIQRIFQQGIPVISVSSALLEDIKRFSSSDFPHYVVPNVVDESFFKAIPSVHRIENRFFMVGQWKLPKKPLVVLEAFRLFLSGKRKGELIIGGYGPLLEEMKEYVNENEMQSSVHFIEALSPKQIAKEMRLANIYLHCSEYETFSVVCAEAMTSGCTVIASKVGGIPEFINEKNGILVEENSPEKFCKAMIMAVDSEFSAQSIDHRFSHEEVGKKYYQVLCGIKK